MSAVAELRVAVDSIQAGIAAAERRLADDLEWQQSQGYSRGITIDDMKDRSGRLILLDYRVALVNGLAALVRAEGGTE